MKYATLGMVLVGMLALGCGGGGTRESDIARLEGRWSGSYTTPSGPMKIELEADANGTITDFGEAGTLIGRTTGVIVHNGGSSYTATLASGLKMAFLLHNTGLALVLTYLAALNPHFGILERNAPPFPAGGFVNGDLFGRSFVGIGGRYDSFLILALILAAGLQLDGVGLLTGNFDATNFSSGGQMATLNNVAIGLWLVALSGLGPGPGQGMILMSPSKRFIASLPCDSDMSPPVEECYPSILEAQ